MFAASFVALSVAAFASASPLAARGASCSPNFEGVGLRVVDSWSGLEFGPSGETVLAPVVSSSFRGPSGLDWHFEQHGQPIVSYIIKDVNNNNLAVSARVDGSILLDTASNSGNAPDQLWTVQCDTCSTGISGIHGKVASQCIIRSPTHNGGCVVVGPSAGSPAIVTNSGSCSYFDFFSS